MRVLLHILTKLDDTFAGDLIRRQEREPGQTVVVADLTQKNPDYKDLVEKVFAADAVNVW